MRLEPVYVAAVKSIQENLEVVRMCLCECPNPGLRRVITPPNPLPSTAPLGATQVCNCPEYPSMMNYWNICESLMKSKVRGLMVWVWGLRLRVQGGC